MSNEIKTGKEILDAFFDGLRDLPDVDEGVVDILVKLHKGDKLTATNISNALLAARQGQVT